MDATINDQISIPKGPQVVCLLHTLRDAFMKEGSQSIELAANMTQRWHKRRGTNFIGSRQRRRRDQRKQEGTNAVEEQSFTTLLLMLGPLSLQPSNLQELDIPSAIVIV